MGNVCSEDIHMCYSVVFIKKIILLRRRHWCFPGQFMNFLKALQNTGYLKYKYEALKLCKVSTNPIWQSAWLQRQINVNVWLEWNEWMNGNMLDLNDLNDLIDLKIWKQSSRGVLLGSCSWKFCKFHRKTPVPDSLF